MSRIYDALKRAQSERTATKNGNGDAEFERRRAKRVAMQVPIFVYGHGLRKEPFHEETTSLVVNSHGALLVLSKKVKPGQRLLLTNATTRQEQPCRVVHTLQRKPKQLEVAVAFPDPAPEFWIVPENEAAFAEKQN